MARSKLLACSALAVGIVLMLPLLGAQKSARNRSLTSLTVHFPKDERVCEELGFRQVSGQFELAKPVQSIAVTVEVYDDGVKTDPFPRTWAQPGDERRGRFAVVFIDLENLSTVVNTNDYPLRLAARRSYYKGWLAMGKEGGARSAGPVDTEKFVVLGGPMQYHAFTPDAATDAGAPLFAMYSGKAPLVTEGVQSADELLKRNPKGRVVIASLRLNDHPGANRPDQR